jgi:DNA primase
MIEARVIEEVRRLVDVVALIGEHVELRKSGSSLVGCCPFHEERRGSFHVYPEEKRFHCYGCGARGDVFEFARRLEAKPFPNIVRDLAAKVGVPIPADAPRTAEEQRAKEERVALLRACEAAAEHWEQRLWGPEGAPARAYLAKRGVREDVARAFRLGYALPKWHDIHDSLKRAQVPLAAQHGAGLLSVKEDPEKGPRYYDRFRDRIIFPILDVGGRVLGFAGRRIGTEPAAPGVEPPVEYLNTRETGLYKKGRTLFGLFQARDAIRRTGRAIVVEGYFDVLALHQAGFAAAVACCGTALTREQVQLVLAAGCRELVLVFDADEGGAKAPHRAAPVLLSAGATTTVVRLPSGNGSAKDPDELVQRQGAPAMERLLAGAIPLTEHLIDEAIRRHIAGPAAQASVEQKVRVVRELTALVLAAPAGLARSIFEKAIARRLDLDIGPLRREVHGAERRAARARPNA